MLSLKELQLSGATRLYLSSIISIDNVKTECRTVAIPDCDDHDHQNWEKLKDQIELYYQSQQQSYDCVPEHRIHKVFWVKPWDESPSIEEVEHRPHREDQCEGY